jgi:hypothetical protein
MTLSISPLVLVENSSSTLVISGLTPNQAYHFQLLPLAEPGNVYETHTRASAYGKFSWAIAVRWGGEALIDVFSAGSDKALTTLHIFAAPPDIARRQPLRVDFHIHTRHSDGHSTPAEMVIRGREIGLDALAITDHNRFAPSLEAIESARKLGLGLLCFTGEEITAWDWHLVAIGARSEIQPEGPGYSSLKKALDEVHAQGGRGYLAHPYWISGRRRNMPPADYDRIL